MSVHRDTGATRAGMQSPAATATAPWRRLAARSPARVRGGRDACQQSGRVRLSSGCACVHGAGERKSRRFRSSNGRLQRAPAQYSLSSYSAALGGAQRVRSARCAPGRPRWSARRTLRGRQRARLGDMDAIGGPPGARTTRSGYSRPLFVWQSKGGPGMIDCLRRAHRAALRLELLGISHTQSLGRRPRTAL